jgi:histidyl-tRNA synthetase
LGETGVRALLGQGRKDESGDFTKGAGLNEAQIDAVLKCIKDYFNVDEIWALADIRDVQTFDTAHAHSKHSLQAARFADELTSERYPDRYFDNRAIIDNLEAATPNEGACRDGLDELREIFDICGAAGYGSKRIRMDPSVVRGLEYYTGPVFEVELTFTTDSRDSSTRFGSVAGGGRYDGLVSRFRGEPVPATGFSIGVSRLLAALQHLGKVETKAEAGPVVVTVFDRDRIADYQQMVAKLRAANIRAELYLGSGKFGPQMKYADRRNAPCVVIQGSDEKAKGEVTIKDLIVGAELAKLEKGREEHLQKQAEAQISVPEAQLVEAVRKVLARHKLPPH